MRETPSDEGFIARCMLSPSSKCSIEVDINHNAAKVKQQCVSAVRLHNTWSRHSRDPALWLTVSLSDSSVMFRWPKTDNPLEWFLEWLITGLPGLISWLGGTVAGPFSGRGTFTQLVVSILF